MAELVDKKYESDKLGIICSVRMGTDEAAIYTEPAAVSDSDLHGFNGSSPKRFGLHTRGVILKGASPALKGKSRFIPVGTVAALAALQKGEELNIGPGAWTITKKKDEFVV